jgi:hypothetical protein
VQAGPGRLFGSALAASTAGTDATVRITRAPTTKVALDVNNIKTQEVSQLVLCTPTVAGCLQTPHAQCFVVATKQHSMQPLRSMPCFAYNCVVRSL